ncbi:hypothetical protein SADUNF_Sadunf13G0108500 [Salix dunnii]|uniref:Uncharacterized protein n=1 Tax=Salix dunnii TaxID=1413687 RepID=A0A835MM91_9ROSI|nr:hypothetical protein SADUNF_Sadunf13G0108500 [Salix dunnii]
MVERRRMVVSGPRFLISQQSKYIREYILMPGLGPDGGSGAPFGSFTPRVLTPASKSLYIARQKIDQITSPYEDYPSSDQAKWYHYSTGKDTKYKRI